MRVQRYRQSVFAGLKPVVALIPRSVKMHQLIWRLLPTSRQIPDLDVILIESGGDNLAATFSPELADLTIYVIDVCMGADIPAKGPALINPTC